jgi:IS30 family transposase
VGRNVHVKTRQLGEAVGVNNLTRITLAWELHEEGVNNSKIAQRLGKHRETIGLWIKGIEAQGLPEFLESYEQAKKGPRKRRQVDPIVKRLVWRLREREHDCCGQKIAYFLREEQGIKLSVTKIYQILAEKYVIRSKWKKNVKRGPAPKAMTPREVVQMDSVLFGEVYAFTAVDIFSREADVLLAPALTASFGYRFLRESMRRRFDGYVGLIQTDGGSEFKEEFKAHVHNYCEHYRVARPYKKNEQSYVESFNRTFRKECLGWGKYRQEEISELIPVVESFLDRYHYHRPHLAFEPMRPPLKKVR